MNALLWKKVIELKNNKIKLISFFITPFLYIILFVSVLKIHQAIFYISLICTYMNMLFCQNPEDIIYERSFLITPMSPKKKWIYDGIIISVASHIWICFCLTLWLLINNIPLKEMLFVLFNFLPTFTLTISINMYHVDYLKVKQWLQVPFGISGVTLIIILFRLPSILPIN